MSESKITMFRRSLRGYEVTRLEWRHIKRTYQRLPRNKRAGFRVALCLVDYRVELALRTVPHRRVA